MTYYADPANDLPARWKRKRVVFYRAGLKIYGQIPYILQRKLYAEFISNNAPGLFGLGGRIIAHSAEANYTIVRYQRPDGQPHSDSTQAALLAWLWAEAGVEWAIARPPEFFDPLDDGPNWFQVPPQTWVPGTADNQPALQHLLAGETNND